VRLTTVGTGAAAPSPHRVCAGHLVDAPGARLLMDCGSGVVHRMATLRLDWAGISHVALTHFDADHVSDLATLLVAFRYGQLPPRAEPCTIVGPPGTQALLERLAAALWDKLLAPGYPLLVRELASGERCELAAGVLLEAHKVPHTDESVGYLVAVEGRRLVYTGDTGYDEGVAAWAAGCDLLLTECSLPDAMAIPSHLTPTQAGRLARLAGARRLVLTHFYPPVERTDVRAAVAAEYGGPVALASDGWTMDLHTS
jgi:ribonuclease BN (tRNA processing enzyme)